MISDPIMKCPNAALREDGCVARGCCYVTLAYPGEDHVALRPRRLAPVKNSTQGVRLSLTLSHGAS